MITSVEIFRTVKQMSKRTLGPRPRVLLGDMTRVLGIPADTILLLLTELEDRGLVEVHGTTTVSVSLTSYGVTQESVSGGLST